MRKTIISIVTAITLLFSLNCGGSGCKTPEDCFKQGTVAFKNGDKIKAYRFFSAAAKEEPTNTAYQWAAANTATNPKFALFHVKTAWDNGLKNMQVFYALVTLSEFSDTTQKYSYALQLFKELPDSIRTDEVRAGLFFSFRRFDSTIALLGPLTEKQPSAFRCDMLSKALLAKGDVERAIKVLVDCKAKNKLDPEGYLLLAHAYLRGFDYKSTDAVFDAARKDGNYIPPLRLAHARMLFAQERGIDALNLLDTLMKPMGDSTTPGFVRETRIAAAYFAFILGQKSRIEALQNVRGGDSGAIAERALYSLLSQKIGDTTRFLDTLKTIVKRLPEYPELQLLLAREIARSGQSGEALALYDRLPETYLRSPRIIVERARLLSMTGRDTMALALLGVMHQRKISTRSSLELLRDITFKMNRIDDAQKVQSLLSSLYKNDVPLRWAGGMLAMKTGKLDSAFTVFTSLCRDYPNEMRFHYSRLFVYYLKGAYDELLNEIGKLGKTSPAIVRLQARTLQKLHKNKEADAAFRTAIASDKSIALKMEYAEFLINTNNGSQAAQIYAEMLKADKGAHDLDTNEYVAVLNNLAWSLLQAENSDKKTVLSTIEKAYSLNKKIPSIVDTYAEALLKYKDFKGCIALLEKSPITVQEAALQIKLSSAYEGVNELTKAIRALEEAKKLMDSGSPGRISTNVDAGEVQSRISSLLAEIKE
jgi:predicted Zn-dependent protease